MSITNTANFPIDSARSVSWTGRVLTGLVVLFFLMDAVMKLVMATQVQEASAQLGWSGESVTTLGIILLACTLIHAYPRTAILGAVLLTGYLGGAVATHLRIDSPLFTHTLFGVYVGIAMWAGLYLRDGRTRLLLGGGAGEKEQISTGNTGNTGNTG